MGRTTESLPLQCVCVCRLQCAVNFRSEKFSKQKFRVLRVQRFGRVSYSAKWMATLARIHFQAFILFIAANAIWFHFTFGFWVLLFVLTCSTIRMRNASSEECLMFEYRKLLFGDNVVDLQFIQRLKIGESFVRKTVRFASVRFNWKFQS